MLLFCSQAIRRFNTYFRRRHFTEIPSSSNAKFNVAKYFLEEDKVRKIRGENDVAVRAEGQNFTYREIRRMSSLVSDYLIDTMNVHKGDRILLCLENSVDLVYSAFGTMLSGAVLTMTVPNHPDDKFYEYMIEYTDTKLVITTSSMYDRICNLVSKNVRVVISSDIVSGDASSSSRNKSTDTVANDMAAWFFTSGTTGPPKGCVHMQRDMAYAAHIYARTIMDVQSDDITMTTSPMTGPYAFQCNILYPFYAGASCIVHSSNPTNDVDEFLRVAGQNSPSIVSTTPKMIRSVLERSDESYVHESLNSIRYLITAGDVLPEALHTKWLEKYDKKLLDGLGNSEAFAFYISNRLDDVVPGSIGTPVEGFDVELVNESRAKVSTPNEPGEIRVRGPSVSVGYWGNQESQNSVFDSEGYFYTGDIATKDENDRFYLLGRVNDLISMHTGEWRKLRVSFLELENQILSSFDTIRDCAVCESTAFVVSKNEKECGESIRNLLENLTGGAESHRVVFVDKIPRNARDKIDRVRLREISREKYAEDHRNNSS